MRYEHVDDVSLHTYIHRYIHRYSEFAIMLLLYSGLAQARPEIAEAKCTRPFLLHYSEGAGTQTNHYSGNLCHQGCVSIYSLTYVQRKSTVLL